MLLSALRDNALHYLLMYTYCLTLMVWKLNVRHGPDVPIDEYEVWLCRSWVSMGQKVDAEVFWTTATRNLKWVTCIHTQDPALTLSSIIGLSSAIIPQPEPVPFLLLMPQCLYSHKEWLTEMANACCPCQTDIHSSGSIPASCLSYKHFEALPLLFPLSLCTFMQRLKGLTHVRYSEY